MASIPICLGNFLQNFMVFACLKHERFTRTRFMKLHFVEYLCDDS